MHSYWESGKAELGLPDEEQGKNSFVQFGRTLEKGLSAAENMAFSGDWMLIEWKII